MLLVLACHPHPVELLPPVAEPVVAVDMDPDPDVAEISLVAEVTDVALNGVYSEVWAWRDMNGGDATVPGPLIDVPVGARLRVHLDNQLPESTTLHFHGIRLPNGMDGTDMTQPLVRPGEQFDYDFRVLDAGTFWYHPHFDTVEQIWRGLYGGVRVTGAPPETEADRVIMLSDVSIDDAGRRVFGSSDKNGREGNQVLVNGAPAGGVLQVRASERWRIINASVARFYTLALSDRPLDVVGTDAGPVATPYPAAHLRLAPGDRFEVHVALAPGETTEFQSLITDRADAVDPNPTLRLFTATRDPDDPGIATPLPETFPSATVAAPQPNPPVRTVTMAQGTAPDGEPLFTIDGVSWPFVTPYTVQQGGSEIWQIVNQTGYDQPFHLHGYFFQVLDIDGTLQDALEDTVEIPRRSTVRLLITFDARGAWMFHTHLLDQAEMGMMSAVVVE